MISNLIVGPQCEEEGEEEVYLGSSVRRRCQRPQKSVDTNKALKAT